MVEMGKKEEIKGMVEKANRLQKEGKYGESLEQSGLAMAEIDLLLDGEIKDSLLGLALHYRGSTLQRMGRYQEAVEALDRAIELRENNAYSVFQRFICKIYGKLLITDEEAEETKLALLTAMANNAASIADIGNMMQNLAYIEQVRWSVDKAILFYKMALEAREQVGDKRGRALTEARLAEVLWQTEGAGIPYGQRALAYFEEIGDIERIKQVKTVFRWK